MSPKTYKTDGIDLQIAKDMRKLELNKVYRNLELALGRPLRKSEQRRLKVSCNGKVPKGCTYEEYQKRIQTALSKQVENFGYQPGIAQMFVHDSLNLAYEEPVFESSGLVLDFPFRG